MTQGHEIREARQLAGLTQQQLATLIGVSMRTVGNWERGETVPQRHAARIWSVLDPLVESGDDLGVSIHDFSDAALLAEIARRFDETRSARALESARRMAGEDLEAPAALGEGHAALIPEAKDSPPRPPGHDARARAAARRVQVEGGAQPDGVRPDNARPWEQDEYSLAAKRGANRGRQSRQRQDAEGEEPDPPAPDYPA